MPPTYSLFHKTRSMHEPAPSSLLYRNRAPATCASQLRLSELVGALSTALDLTEGQPVGHSMRTCILGMRLAESLRLSLDDRSALFYALLLKDLGCSSNASRVCNLFGADDLTVKREFKTTNTSRLRERLAYVLRHLQGCRSTRERVATLIRLGVSGQKEAGEFIRMRCERGADIARLFELPEATADAIYALDEHWNGRGQPHGFAGEQIPLLARILCLAQTVEVFVERDGVTAALDMARERSGSWFDPDLVARLTSMEGDTLFWSTVRQADPASAIAMLEPEDRVLAADASRLDRVCLGFARVVDAKSPWTRRHSEGVAEIARGIAGAMGLSRAGEADDIGHTLYRVGLLHDIGKLGVSNLILDKPGRLDDDELQQMRLHPRFTERILAQVPCLSEVTALAASHHERLDGKGYHTGLTAERLSTPARIMVVADMFEAMTAERPYRDTMPIEKVLGILDKDSGTAVCGEVVAGLRAFVDREGYTPSSFQDVEPIESPPAPLAAAA